MRCGISRSTNRSSPMSSRERVFSVSAAHSPQQPGNLTPSEHTQHSITNPTIIKESYYETHPRSLYSR